MKGVVSVLLATFNGQEYLPQLLDSLVAQTHPGITLTVRDDGSTDATLKILKRYEDKIPITLLQGGERLGAAKSFLRLLRNADSESEFFAFCDQDDVWYPEKIERAATRLGTCDNSRPHMYFSCLEHVDLELKHLSYSRPPHSPCFANALVEDVVSGCTVLLNRAARDLIIQQMPDHVLMHDWWCYLIVSALGKVVFDPWPSIRHRLHGKNDSAAATSFFGDYWLRMKRWWKKGSEGHLLRAQVTEFASFYRNSLQSKELALLDRFLGARGTVRSRLGYALRMDVFRQSALDTMILRALIILGYV